MIKVRAIQSNDIKKIRQLHELYYSQYEFPDFTKMLNAFIIEDENNKIVMAGAVEHVAEAMLVTNKEISRIKIGKALVEAQRCAAFTCKMSGIRDLYAFTDNNEYALHLKQHGFIDCDIALRLRID